MHALENIALWSILKHPFLDEVYRSFKNVEGALVSLNRLEIGPGYLTRTAQSMMAWKKELEFQREAETEVEDSDTGLGPRLREQREIVRAVLVLNHQVFNGGKPWLGSAKENLDATKIPLMDKVQRLAKRQS